MRMREKISARNIDELISIVVLFRWPWCDSVRSMHREICARISLLNVWNRNSVKDQFSTDYRIDISRIRSLGYTSMHLMKECSIPFDALASSIWIISVLDVNKQWSSKSLLVLAMQMHSNSTWVRFVIYPHHHPNVFNRFLVTIKTPTATVTQS